MRMIARFSAPLLAAAALLFAGTAVFTPPRPAYADEIDDKITAMKDAAKAKDSGACIAKMVELQDSLDDRVNKALTGLVKDRETKIAAAAIRQLGLRKDEAFGKKIAKAVDNKKLYKADDDTVYLAYLDAAAMYANPKNGNALAGIVKKFMPTNPRFATKAIKAYGSVRDKKVVDQLIEWLVQSESTGQSQGGKNASQETIDNMAKAKNAIIEALAELTYLEIGDGKSWQNTWDKKRKNFEFPDPNAANVDPATLSDWTDFAYGYKITKPEGETWTFCDAGVETVRMRLESRDPKDELVMARADFLIHNLSTQSPKSLKELAKWYEEQFREQRISQASKEPVIEEKKIGGREFLVVSARGDSGSYYSGWGTIEVRVYLTKVGHIAVRMEGLVRLGAEEAEQKALWDAIESAEWTD
jgi:hypothetical protein